MANNALPHWDMTVVYPSLESAEFEQGFQAAIRSIDGLTALFDRHGIALRDPAALDEATVAAAERAIERYNAVLKELITLNAYIRSFVTTDSRDERGQARLSELQQQFVRLSQLSTRFTAWLGALD